MKSRRTIVLAAAIPLLTGIMILGAAAITPFSVTAAPCDVGALLSGLGFALAGLGLLALTRQKDRARTFVRVIAILLGLLSTAGLIVIGLDSVAAIQPATAQPLVELPVAAREFNLLLSLGFMGTALALFALTLTGRKRAGASAAASLGITVAIIGLSAIVEVILRLHPPGVSLFDSLMGCTLLAILGFGLFGASSARLEEISAAHPGPVPCHSLSIATGACLGLMALSAVIMFGLTSRESEDARRINAISQFRDALRDVSVSLKHAEMQADAPADRGSTGEASFNGATAEVHEALRQLNALATWPAYEQLFAAARAEINAVLAQLCTAFDFRLAGRDREAIQSMAVLKISGGSSSGTSDVSKLDDTLRIDSLSRMTGRGDRRRNTAIVLSAAGAAIIVLLGAVHLLFQRDSVARQRSEGALRRHNETLKSYAHTIAHDLRAPLRGIAGYAEELESQSHLLDPRGRHCIAQINTAAHTLERMIGDTLDYAQLDAETPNLSTISLPALIASLLQQRATVIRQHGTVVDTHYGIVTVTSWERGLVQLVGNLLDNAIKYSRHAHPPRVRIETAQTPLSWRLVIYDNGVGFDMKYHDRIFGLFKRLVTSEEFEGTGAGLAIVRKITDRLGGTVCAEGRPGSGATFLVEIPRVLSSELA